MLWLAAYPHSGVEYLQRILRDACGVTFAASPEDVRRSFAVVSCGDVVVPTDRLPPQLPPNAAEAPVVYLLRDGRDCAVSLASARRRELGGMLEIEQILSEVIESKSELNEVGWSRHVREWTPLAAVVVRFEEMIENPRQCVERLLPFLPNSIPDFDRIPTYEQFKTSGRRPETQTPEKHAHSRRIYSGRWTLEMPHAIHLRYVAQHGRELACQGYLEVSPETQRILEQSLSVSSQTSHGRTRVLIDGTKLLDERIDGIHRYVREMLIAMQYLVTTEEDSWRIDVALGKCGIYPLSDIVAGIHRGDVLNTVAPGWTRHKGKPARKPGNPKRRAKLLQRGWDWLSRKFHHTIRSLHKRYCKLTAKLSGAHAPDSYGLVHLTLPNTWHLYQSQTAPVLTTVHDLSHLACPELQTVSNVNTLQRGLDWSAERSATYLSVSHATKEQMVRLLGSDPDSIDVVHNAVRTETFHPVTSAALLQSIREKYHIPAGPFLLCLGTIEPRKNLTNIVRAFQMCLDEQPELRLNLVIAGGSGWENHRELNDRIQACPQIRRIGYVDESDLPALYSAATALCYVSRYEGFGLPILEAMACGTAVIYGDNSSMPEIAANAGLPAVAEDPGSIKRAMQTIVADDESRRRMEVEAVVRAHAMTWIPAARQTLHTYRRAIELHRVQSDQPATTIPIGRSEFDASVKPEQKQRAA